MRPSPNIEFARSEFVQGRLAEAERVCRQILAGDRNNCSAVYLLGLIASRRGKFNLAVTFLDRAIAIDPGQPEIHNELARVYVELGRLDEAAEHFESALVLAPGEASLHRNLGNARMELGHFSDAEASFRLAAAIDPSDPEAHVRLGMALRAQEQFDAAESSLRRAASLQPNSAEIWTNLGRVLHEKGRYEAALACARRAASANPGDFVTQNNLGLLLGELGRWGEAEEFLKKALSGNPSYVGALLNFGSVLLAQGKHLDAISTFERALVVDPGNPSVLNDLGNVLMAQGRYADAIRAFERALVTDPDNPELLNNLAGACHAGGLLARAKSTLDRILARHPEHPMALNHLGTLALSLGEPERALEYFGQAIRARSDFLAARQNLLFCTNYLDIAPADIFEKHTRLGEEIEGRLTPLRHTPSNTRDPDRRLKVGYVSADFCQHAVAHMVEPVIAAHDRSRFEIFCYSSGPTQDEVTERIRKLADHWQWIADVSDDAVAEEIRTAGIDILVDLSGHTANNRITLFARKPAPVQVAWMGYMATTGLKSIEYRITDGLADPPGLTEAFHTETLWRLPSVTVFRPSDNSPEVTPLPALSGGVFTFGSLNKLAKVTPKVISVWSRVLRANPNSRLLLGSVPNDGTRERLAHQFGENQIGEDRLVFKQKIPLTDYLKVHEEIDLALDPFPYNGGATSCHSLWMGVPFITLAGDRYMGRMGVSLLSSVGLAELIANSIEEYIGLACAFARDPERLAGIRSSLRDRMRRSLCDAAAFTRNLESAYRDMWRRWCDQSTSPPGTS